MAEFLQRKDVISALVEMLGVKRNTASSMIYHAMNAGELKPVDRLKYGRRFIWLYKPEDITKWFNTLDK